MNPVLKFRQVFLGDGIAELAEHASGVADILIEKVGYEILAA